MTITVLSPKLQRNDLPNGGARLMHWCPACQEFHEVAIGAPQANGALWTYNGNPDRPSFSPSLHLSTGHHVPGHRGDCWCTYNAKHPQRPAPYTCKICHYVLTDGKIAFCTDSTHALAGQTVDLPDIPADKRG